MVLLKGYMGNPKSYSNNRPVFKATQMENRQKDLLNYFLLTYAFSWFFTVPLALRAQGILDIGFTGPATYIASFGPAIAAIALTYKSNGMQGLRSLLKKLVMFKAKARWYALAFFARAVTRSSSR